MRGIALVVLGLATVSMAADRLAPVAPKVPANSQVLPGRERDLRPVSLRTMNITTPVVEAASAPLPAGVNPPTPSQIPGPLPDDKMQQTYLAPEGVVLPAATLKEPISNSLVQLHEATLHPGTAAVFAGQGGAHELHYSVGPSPTLLVVGDFDHIASGKHEYILSLSAAHGNKPLKDQVSLLIGSTQVSPASIFAVSDDQVAVRFTYDPTNTPRGNELTVWISSAPQPQLGADRMEFRQLQLLMK